MNNHALSAHEQLWQLYKRRYGAVHPQTLVMAHNLALVYSEAGRCEQAAALLEETLHAKQGAGGGDDPSLARTTIALANVYLDLGRVEDAAAMYAPFFSDGMVLSAPKIAMLGATHQAALLGGYARLLMVKGEFSQAVRASRDCLSARQQIKPEQWSTAYARTTLGAALTGTQEYAEAESHLLEGYSAMKQSEHRIPIGMRGRLVFAVQQLVDLYDAWDKPYEATWWRTVLEEQTAANQAAAAPMSGASEAANQGQADDRR